MQSVFSAKLWYQISDIPLLTKEKKLFQAISWLIISADRETVSAYYKAKTYLLQYWNKIFNSFVFFNCYYILSKPIKSKTYFVPIFLTHLEECITGNTNQILNTFAKIWLSFIFFLIKEQYDIPFI